MNDKGLDYIRNIPRDAWKKKEWPICAPTSPRMVQEEIPFPEEHEEEKHDEGRIRYPEGEDV